MSVIDKIGQRGRTAFSFELLPPLKGNNIDKLYDAIDTLWEFEPAYINITDHRSEYVFKDMGNGTYTRQRLRRRPGSVAVAAAIKNKYDISVVPHVLCSGFTREDTEYELLEKKGNAHALDLAYQIQDFNKGIFVDGSQMLVTKTPFNFGVACYPEKHEEAPNMERDIYWLKQKQEAGAQYAVTQLFYDNSKYFNFLKMAREAGVTIPIIPGIKPMSKLSQLAVIPKTFKVDLPKELVSEALKLHTDDEMKQLGIEWGVQQCKDLIKAGVPSLHFYALGATDSVKEIAKKIF